MDKRAIERSNILKAFDRLLSSGALLWTKPTARYNINENGFPFEFLVCPSQVTKPAFPDANGHSIDSESNKRSAHIVDSQSKDHSVHDNGPEVSAQKANHSEETAGSASNATENDPQKPQSDIDNGEEGYHITNVGTTHRLIFNKFCIYRPQYILLTQDVTQKQTSPLNASDFAAAWTMLQSLEGKHFVLFNCGRAAGGSRMHKHLQIFEQPHDKLLPDILLEGTGPSIPYKHYLTALGDVSDDPETAAETLTKEYQQQLSQFAYSEIDGNDETNGSSNGDAEVMAHNVLLTKRWIMVIPRRKAGLGNATANAAGMIGMVWVPNEETVELWKELKPLHVLNELGVAS